MIRFEVAPDSIDRTSLISSRRSCFSASDLAVVRSACAVMLVLFLTVTTHLAHAQLVQNRDHLRSRDVVLPPDEGPRSCEVSLDVGLYEGPEPALNRSCLREWGAIILARQVARRQEDACLQSTPDHTGACLAGCTSSGRRHAGRRELATCEARCRSNAPRSYCHEVARARFLEVLRWRLADIRSPTMTPRLDASP